MRFPPPPTSPAFPPLARTREKAALHCTFRQSLSITQELKAGRLLPPRLQLVAAKHPSRNAPINSKEPQAVPYSLFSVPCLSHFPRAFNRADHRRRLVDRLGVLQLGNGVGDDARAGLYIALAADGQHGTNGDA